MKHLTLASAIVLSNIVIFILLNLTFQTYLWIEYQSYIMIGIFSGTLLSSYILDKCRSKTVTLSYTDKNGNKSTKEFSLDDEELDEILALIREERKYQRSLTK